MGKHFSFVHCADLHLGEPFQGLRPGDKGPWTEAIGKATFAAFEKVVDIAVNAHADALLITGDVYNSSHHSLAAQMALRESCTGPRSRDSDLHCSRES